MKKELQTYLKAASSALPCAEARAAFEGYVHCVAQDVCSATSEESFTVVVAQLGSTPEQAARDFMESQSPETIARWKAAAHRHKFRLPAGTGFGHRSIGGVGYFFRGYQRCADYQYGNYYR